MASLVKMDDEKLDEMLERKGFDPEKFIDRRGAQIIAEAFGISCTRGYLGKLAAIGGATADGAATRNEGPEYFMLNGRALMAPRVFLRWLLSRASAPRRSPPPEARRPRPQSAVRASDRTSGAPYRRKSVQQVW
jgi:hypothetical protein